MKRVSVIALTILLSAFVHHALGQANWNKKQVKCLTKHVAQKVEKGNLSSVIQSTTKNTPAVIGIGSFGAGIREYEEFKDAIVFNSVDQGCTSLLLPENFHATNKLNAYVSDKTDDLLQSLTGLSVASVTEEFESFLRTVKGHNLTSAINQIRFVGFEFSDPGPAIEFIRLFFIKEEPPVAEIVDPILREFNKSWRLVQHADQNQLHLMEREVSQACNLLNDTIQSWLGHEASDERRKVFKDLQYNSHLVKHYAQLIKAPSYSKRDSLLAQNVLLAREIFDLDRSILVLDNFALSKGMSNSPGDNLFPEKTFGTFMNEALAEDYTCIALSAFNGSNLHSPDDPRALKPQVLAPADAETIEGLVIKNLEPSTDDLVVLDLTSARQKRKLKWLRKPLTFRTTSMNGVSNSEFHRGDLPAQFDYLVIFKDVKPSQTFVP